MYCGPYSATYKIASPPQTKMTNKDDIKGLVSLKFLRPCLSLIHGVYRVLSFFSSRWNWDSSTPSPAGGGGGTLACGRGSGGGPNTDAGTYTVLLYVYMYICSGRWSNISISSNFLLLVQ
jgi:hypothetical protein